MAPKKLASSDRKRLLSAMYLRFYGPLSSVTESQLGEMFDRFKKVEFALALAAGNLPATGIDSKQVHQGSLGPLLTVKLSKTMRERIRGVGSLARVSLTSDQQDLQDRAEQILGILES